MSARIIPVLDQRQNRRPETPPALPATAQPLRAATGELRDNLGRALHDLRISVTDRCNFRCGYCMPREIFGPDYPHLPHGELLSFEEITRLARAFAAHGVRKIRLTGGEPLLRKNIEILIEQLAQLRTPDGQPLELTLTTNASLLARKARALKDAGLARVTVSLDALDDAVFRRMNDADFPVADVLEGIEAARAVGLAPIKINMVVQRGVNDGEILPMARHFKREGLALRFIEYMDVGASNGWRMDQVLPSRDVLALLQSEFALRPLEAAAPGETAERWAYEDGSAEVGFISSVTKAFCGDCNRARVSIEGRLFLCLFASQGYDLRALLRPGTGEASDEEITSAIAHIWAGRKDRYSELRAALPPEARQDQRRVEMSYIGG